MSPRIWTPEQVAALVRLYPTLPPAEVAEAIGRPLKSVQGKANTMGIKSFCAPGRRPGHREPPKPKKASPCLPAAKPVRAPVRGPAHLPGDIDTLPRSPGFRHIVCPRTPDPIRTQTFSMFGG